MLRIAIRISICISVLLLSYPFLYAREYLRKLYRLADGLPQSQVNCVVEDKKGYLWAGTQYGLARFDGTEFRNYYSQDGLPSSIISCLKVDNRGNLWIGTSSGLSMFDGKRFIQLHSLDKVLDIQDIHINSRDEVYFVWSSGWGKVEKGEIVNLPLKFDLAQSSLLFISEDNEGTFFLATDDRKIIVIHNNQTNILDELSKSVSIISTVKWDPYQKQLWIGTDRGLYYLKEGHLLLLESNIGINGNKIVSILPQSGNEVLIAVYGSGVYLLKKGQMVGILQSPGSILNCAYKDKSENIWLGYDGRGLGRLSLSPFENIPNLPGVFVGFPMCILQDKKGNIWVSTIHNGLYKFKNKDDRAPEHFLISSDLTLNSIRSMVQSDVNTFWLGTANGIVRFEDGKLKRFSSNDGLTHPFVRSIFIDNHKTLWISTDNGITLLSDGKFRAFELNSELQHPMVRQVIQDKMGVYWIATLGGLYYYKAGRLHSFEDEKKINKIPLETILFDSKGNLWLGGIDSLLVFKKDGSLKRFGVEDGFESNTVYFIIEDNEGTVWVGTGNGVQYYLDGRFFLYNQENGLIGNECNARACMKDRNGNLWFGLLEGLSIYVRTGLFEPKKSPPVYIEEFQIDGKPMDLSKPVEVPHYVSRFVFKYHSVNLNPAVRIKYHVRLDPIERKWSDPSSERIKEYLYLAPGNYTFYAGAFVNSKLDRANQKQLKFTIIPPIWKRWWFILIIAVTFAGIVAVFISLRIHRLQKEGQQLRQAVKERTQELQEKNRELESFAYTVSHDLKDPVGVIVGYAHVLEDFLKKQGVHGTEQFVEGIKRNSDRIINFIDDLLQLSRSGKVIEKLSLTDVRILVSQITNDLIQKRKLKPGFLKMDNMPLIMADADRLYMVFYNLITNAYKYRNKKKKLKINITYQHSGDYHQFAVKDNGIGIKEEDYKKIFQPGVRLRVVDTSGTGFGLRIVKKIVEAHGGKVWVESKAGAGSTFYFSIKAVSEGGKTNS